MNFFSNDLKLPKRRVLSFGVEFNSAVLCATPVSDYLKKLAAVLARF